MVQLRSTSFALSTIGAVMTSYAIYGLIPSTGWITVTRDGVSHWIVSIMMIIFGVVMFSVGFALVISGGEFVEPPSDMHDHDAYITDIEQLEERD